jgi:hypothetical protein
MLNVPTLSQMLTVVGVALLGTAVVVAALGALLGSVQRSAVRRRQARQIAPAQFADDPASVPGQRPSHRQDQLINH